MVDDKIELRSCINDGFVKFEDCVIVFQKMLRLLFQIDVQSHT